LPLLDKDDAVPSALLFLPFCEYYNQLPELRNLMFAPTCATARASKANCR